MKVANLSFQNLFPKPTSKNTWIAFTVLVIGLSLTMGTAYFTYLDMEEQANHEYSLICNEIKAKIEKRLNAHAQLLRSNSAIFGVFETVTRNNWKEFVSF